MHYSIQNDHVHAIVEATSERDLAAGMKSIGSRFARAVNRVFRLRGRVLADRYHLHVLRTPREVRNALAYCLLNARRHLAETGRALSRAAASIQRPPDAGSPVGIVDSNGLFSGSAARLATAHVAPLRRLAPSWAHRSERRFRARWLRVARVIRVHAFMVRRSDISRDEFRDHYEQIHVPTALPILGGTTRYVRHHVREEIHGVPPFDCMTLFEYPDAATIGAVFARVAGPEAAAVHADEDTFMDTAANFFFPVEEEGPVWQAAGAPAHAREVALVCARRPQGEDATAFRTRFASDALPRLRAAVDDAAWLRAAWPQPATARYGATVLLGAARVAGLEHAARDLEREGAQVIAVRVTAHATDMALYP